MVREIDTFGTTTIAVCVFFLGYAIVSRSRLLREYSIPESVVGGSIAAIVIGLLYQFTDTKILFDVERRDILLVYFFTALGLRSNLRELLSNGQPLLILVALAACMIVVQNAVGITLAGAFGFDPPIGIVAGSMALVGRSGTTVAWAPIFQADFGLDAVSRLGLGVNMIGLIAACCIAGPIARSLIRRHQVATPGPGSDLDVGTSHAADGPSLDYYAFLLALLRIHVTILLGQAIGFGLEAVSLRMPLYVSCLIGGLLLGSFRPRIGPTLDWSGSDQCLTLIAYVSLSLFYTITFMNLQIWAAGAYFSFIITTIIIQVMITVVFIYFVVFRAMGADYDAAVISAGFAGIALGSTATTMAVMTAVAKQYGQAHRAFLIVPLACGVFIDIINSLAIHFFADLYS